MLTPLHTRMISLRLTWGEPGALHAEGRIFDLRKRGIVPLGGKLKGPGVVHDMAVSLDLDVADLRITRIEPAMRAFPFAPSPATRGEGCPDRLPDVQCLVGVSLREGYGTAVTGRVGGPLGCFHIFTLLRLIGPTIESVVARERTLARSGPPGSTVFSRSVVMDGLKGEDLSIVLRGTLFDLYYRPGADALPLEEELEASFEASADLQVDVPGIAISTSQGRVRRGGPSVERVGTWEPVPLVGDLVGRQMLKGYTAQVQEVFAGREDVEPLQHLLFMLAPTLMQCFPSLAEELELRPRRAEATHGAVDSCHMWRAGGPLIHIAPLPGGG